MTSSPSRIRWHRPQRGVRRSGGGSDLMRADTMTTVDARVPSADAIARLDIEVQTLLRVGVPIAEGVTTAKELAVELLKLVAEVEHALMAQYLYTYISVANADG